MAGAVFAGSTANADTRIDNNHVRVEAGDSLYTIAQHNGTDVETIVRDNNLTNPEMIHVGDILVVTPGQQGNAQTNQGNQATTNTTVSNNGAKVATSGSISQASTSQASTSVNLSGNSMAALRRSIESGGNYNTNTGNGYLGAYQFAPQTIAGIENATGMKWSMDPATQDAFANYYANTRYGGWQNVPTSGGW